ncbi:BrnA antitoxin family protein [Tabrizicola sp.]|uniref:BrnA antitoxin family protein n=1 Tax=Tabrizicola sp. TaxID=2005166 RepID=UPI001A5A9C7D|nr:BrnA antitoxin family protein [Tabrizicola sp.]MBL9074908.1 BrnA antitoxin family protein [Tabrizicola sp.]
MPESKQPLVHPYDPDTYGDAAFDPVDDVPDLSTPYWIEQFSKVKVQRGRPLAAAPKISTTIRLDPEVIAHFKADGPGWQSRINEALRKAAGL